MQLQTKRGKTLLQHLLVLIGHIMPSLQVNGGLKLIGCFMGHFITGSSDVACTFGLWMDRSVRASLISKCKAVVFDFHLGAHTAIGRSNIVQRLAALEGLPCRNQTKRVQYMMWYRRQVDDHNNLCHSPILLEESVSTEDWKIRLFTFIIAIV
jgi:hypothetical protein